MPTLALAVAYANSTVSPLTPVYYFLGPAYDSIADRDGHVFEHPVQIRGWSFVDAEPLTDGKGGGSAPFMGTVNKGQGGVSGVPAGRVPESGMRATFIDHTKAPLFPTRLRIGTYPGNEQFIQTDPPTFTFKKASYITGVTWLGVNETLRNATGEQTLSDPFSQIKNSWFDQILTPVWSTSGQNRRNKCLTLMSVMFSENSGWNTVRWHKHDPIITAYEEIKVNNVGIGPQGLAGNAAANLLTILCSVARAMVFRLAGLFMCGNIIFLQERCLYAKRHLSDADGV